MLTWQSSYVVWMWLSPKRGSEKRYFPAMAKNLWWKQKHRQRKRKHSTPEPTFSHYPPNQHYDSQQLKMPSRGNPNVPNKQRRIASRSKTQSKNASSKITKNPRGTARSTVLHPTSGPLAPVSGKKARKLEKAQNNARRRAIERAMEQEGEVEMTGKRSALLLWSFLTNLDAPKTTTSKKVKAEGEKMDVDEVS
jgi:hypothetical protein